MKTMVAKPISKRSIFDVSTAEVEPVVTPPSVPIDYQFNISESNMNLRIHI